MAPTLLVQRAGRALGLCTGARTKANAIRKGIEETAGTPDILPQERDLMNKDGCKKLQPLAAGWSLGESCLHPFSSSDKDNTSSDPLPTAPCGDVVPEILEKVPPEPLHQSESSEEGSDLPKDILRLESAKTAQHPPNDEKVFIDRCKASEVRQPGDGSCLFHALSYGLADGTSARRLRREICAYIKDNPDMEIASMTLQDWIKFDTGRSVRRYAEKMAGGAEGGGIEIEVFTRLKRMSVNVYERSRQGEHGGYRRIGFFDAGPDSKGEVNILYRKRMHYDSLVVLQNQIIAV